METASPNSRQQPKWTVKLVGFGGLGLVLGWLLAWVAEANGLLFGGVDVVFATLISGCCCGLATAITAALLERKGGNFTWQAGCLGAVALSVAATSLWSFFCTRKNLEILISPMQVPADLRVQRGHRFLHSMHVHFIGSPATISALIQAKQLVEVPAALPDVGEPDIASFSARRQSAEEWDWWRPASMPGAKFYYLHHKSQAIQGWAEGWWVNGATNEVYAFI